MTLNMPQLLNSFPTSAAAGEGFESQYVEKFFLEATGLVPIGSIIAWAKSFTGVPALDVDTLFVECNGQVLNDSASLLDGQTMPNLNTGGVEDTHSYFLRGHSTSGTTGASTNKSHSHAVIASDTGGVNTSHFHMGPSYYHAGTTQSSGGAEARPMFYTVVWLIRVK